MTHFKEEREAEYLAWLRLVATIRWHLIRPIFRFMVKLLDRA